MTKPGRQLPAGPVELYLLRHAHAGDPVAWHGPDDRRPLSERGRRQAERLGRFLAEIGFRPDALLSSPKARALETAELVGTQLGIVPAVDPRLASGLGIAELEQVLIEAGNPLRPVIVGHDPDLSDLVALLCASPAVPLRKGALARIDAERPLAHGSGILRWLIPPDLLKAE